MSDKLHRFLIENIHIRGEWVNLQSAWQEIQNTADYPKAIQKVLGEALAAISLLTESLKLKGSLVLQIRGTYPVSMLVVQATSAGGLRGIARWDHNIEIKDDVTFLELFGKSGEGSSSLVISVEPNDGGKHYQSLVALQGANLAECLGEYFSQSEQLKTRFWLSADENKATGLMLQSLPATVDNNEMAQADNARWQHATVLADTLSDEELLGLDVTTLLHRLYHQDQVRLFDAQSLYFECTCSQQKIENTIRSLGEAEATEIIEEQGSISINCEFCNAHYELDKVDVKKLFITSDVVTIPDSTDVSGSVH